MFVYAAQGRCRSSFWDQLFFGVVLLALAGMYRQTVQHSHFLSQALRAELGDIKGCSVHVVALAVEGYALLMRRDSYLSVCTIQVGQHPIDQRRWVAAAMELGKSDISH